MTKRLPTETNDEIAKANRWINAFMERIQKLLHDILKAPGDADTTISPGSFYK